MAVPSGEVVTGCPQQLAKGMAFVTSTCAFWFVVTDLATFPALETLTAGWAGRHGLAGPVLRHIGWCRAVSVRPGFVSGGSERGGWGGRPLGLSQAGVGPLCLVV